MVVPVLAISSLSLFMIIDLSPVMAGLVPGHPGLERTEDVDA
jgi:hypothetical protein